METDWEADSSPYSVAALFFAVEIIQRICVLLLVIVIAKF